MKTSLLFLWLVIAAIISSSEFLSGQTLILSENYSGFSTGSHGTPSTTDAASTLDSKTSIPGWAGSKIYSAGGEIKVGTATLTGWITTPALDLSANSGNFAVTFDICRYSGDAATVQVYLDSVALGNVMTPADTFQTMHIIGTGGTNLSKIRVLGLTKRFYLDNFAVSTNLPTRVSETKEFYEMIQIYPVPAFYELNIRSSIDISLIEIFDSPGRKVISIKGCDSEIVKIPVESLSAGLYIIRLTTSRGTRVMKFVKV